MAGQSAARVSNAVKALSATGSVGPLYVTVHEAASHAFGRPPRSPSPRRSTEFAAIGSMARTARNVGLSNSLRVHQLAWTAGWYNRKPDRLGRRRLPVPPSRDSPFPCSLVAVSRTGDNEPNNARSSPSATGLTK